MSRDPEIARLLEAHRAACASASGAVMELFDRCHEALATPGRPNRSLEPETLPVCRHLDEAFGAVAPGAVQGLADCLAGLAPRLAWKRREDIEYTDPGFPDGHANTVLVGAGGFEEHRDVRLGVSLVAPGVTYPDHRHPPEEGYLVLSAGCWRQHHGEWFERASGETVHNVTNIWHAMRAGPVPLLAMWMLWTGA